MSKEVKNEEKKPQEKPEVKQDAERDGKAQAACGQRYTMGCGKDVQLW